MKRLFIDGHNDTMMRVLDKDTKLPVVNIGEDTKFHIDIEKLQSGGLNAPVFAAFSEGYYENGEQNIEKSLSETLSIINGLYYTEKENKERFKIVNRVEEIIENQNAGRISAIPSIEGAYFIDENNYIEIIKQLKDLKIKILGYNWNHGNYLGVGAGETYSDRKTEVKGGITDLGIKTLRELDKSGIGIDVSHMNEETFWGVIKNAKNPIIATHSGADAIRNHRRNLKDDQLLAIKDNGGIVGIVLCASFIKEKDANLDDYMEHLFYILDLIGVDHVAIGSDLDGTTLPMGIRDSSEMYKIVDKLEEKYSKEEVDKIISGNFIRVFETLEKNEEYNILENIEIKTDYEMGEVVGQQEFLEIMISEENLDVSIIIDGIVVENFVNMEKVIEVEFDVENEEQFHILTIQVEKQGNIFRDTKIVRLF